MFVVSTKLKSKKLLIILAAAAAVILGLVLIFSGGGGENGEEAFAGSVKLKTTQERIDYLTGLGWQLAEGETEAKVRVPETFEGVYADYLRMQENQGFKLSRYAGQEVVMYTYTVLNHPSGEEGVTANLLVRKNKLIGGDVRSANENGFIHSLAFPEG